MLTQQRRVHSRMHLGSFHPIRGLVGPAPTFAEFPEPLRDSGTLGFPAHPQLLVVEEVVACQRKSKPDHLSFL